MGKSIGIDLGTTNTVVSYRNKKNEIKILKNGGKKVTPTAVYFETKDRYIVGTDALKKGMIHPEALATNFKYNMGESKKITYRAENGDRVSVTPTKLAEIVIREVLKKASEKIIKEFPGEEIDKAVITVPAKFNPLQKKNTKAAALNAGIEEIKLALESTAAAIAYAEEEQISSKIMVYDFGGGTFDVSLIEKTGTGFREIVAPDGDRNLGGNILTAAVADYIFDKIEEKTGLEMPKNRNDYDEDEYEGLPEEVFLKNYIEVYKAAEKLKEEMVDSEEASEILNIIKPESGQEFLEISIDYKTFYKLTKEYIEKTIKIVNRIIEESGLKKDDIETIILTGGSSLVKSVRIELEKYFDRQIHIVKTDTLISEGACILTENLDSLKMENKLPNDIGVAVLGEFSRKVFKRLLKAGTPEKDAFAQENFKLSNDNQKELKIQLYERDINNYPNAKRISDEGCILIDELIMKLPENLKTDVKIVLKLNISEEGILILNVIIYDKNGNEIYKEDLSVKREEIVE